MVYPEFDDDAIVEEVAACLFYHLVLLDVGEDSLLKGRTSVRVPVNYLHQTFFCVHYLLFSINRKKKPFNLQIGPTSTKQLPQTYLSKWIETVLSLEF